MNRRNDDNTVYGFGSTYGNDLVGNQHLESYQPNPNKPSGLSIPAIQFPMIPVFLQNYVKQVQVMTRPTEIFVTPTICPDTKPYAVSNHPVRVSERALISPLSYIGMPL